MFPFPSNHSRNRSTGLGQLLWLSQNISKNSKLNSIILVTAAEVLSGSIGATAPQVVDDMFSSPQLENGVEAIQKKPLIEATKNKPLTLEQRIENLGAPEIKYSLEERIWLLNEMSREEKERLEKSLQLRPNRIEPKERLEKPLTSNQTDFEWDDLLERLERLRGEKNTNEPTNVINNEEEKPESIKVINNDEEKPESTNLINSDAIKVINFDEKKSEPPNLIDFDEIKPESIKVITNDENFFPLPKDFDMNRYRPHFDDPNLTPPISNEESFAHMRDKAHILINFWYFSNEDDEKLKMLRVPLQKVLDHLYNHREYSPFENEITWWRMVNFTFVYEPFGRYPIPGDPEVVAGNISEDESEIIPPKIEIVEEVVAPEVVAPEVVVEVAPKDVLKRADPDVSHQTSAQRREHVKAEFAKYKSEIDKAAAAVAEHERLMAEPEVSFSSPSGPSAFEEEQMALLKQKLELENLREVIQEQKKLISDTARTDLDAVVNLCQKSIDHIQNKLIPNLETLKSKFEAFSLILTQNKPMAIAGVITTVLMSYVFFSKHYSKIVAPFLYRKLAKGVIPFFYRTFTKGVIPFLRKVFYGSGAIPEVAKKVQEEVQENVAPLLKKTARQAATATLSGAALRILRKLKR